MRGGGKEHRKQQSLGFEGEGVFGRREEKEEEHDHIDCLSFSLSFFLSRVSGTVIVVTIKVPELNPNFLPSGSSSSF